MARRRMRFGMLGLVLVIGAAACDSWRQVGFGPEHQRNNAAERTITPDNVATLELQWETSLGTADGEPIVDGGKVFVTGYEDGVGTVYAPGRRRRIDGLATGDRAWPTGPADPPR